MRTVVHDPNEPVVIRGYAFEYEAELARAVLEAHGMPALLVREGFDGLGAGPVHLAVRREDAEAALRALEGPAGAEDDGSGAGPAVTSHRPGSRGWR
ncbi:MAG TPA: hypothetical protein VGE02_12820 [Gemmatimonadales bacterium]